MLTCWGIEKGGALHSVYLEEERAMQQATKIGGQVHRMLSHAGLIARIASLEVEVEELRHQLRTRTDDR